MKYGLYYFKNTHNIGDDFWAYAQSLFYPRIDYLIDNTTAYNFKSENNEKVATIIGAFVEPYNYEYAFLLPNCVVPLFAGAYFRPTMREILDNDTVKKWFSEYAPIGCRTKKIADDFNSTGIDAYFSGCISLTLPNLKIRKQQYICLVDVPDYVADYVKQKVGDKFEIKTLSHNVADIARHSALDITERFQIVQNLINIYAAAHCVITSRLHVALPCLTQNTPILFVVPDEPAIGVNDIHVRVCDYFDLVHHNFYSDFINGNIDYDFVNPPLNPNKYLSYKNNLWQSCTDFINRCETDDISTPLALSGDDKYKILQDKIVWNHPGDIKARGFEKIDYTADELNQIRLKCWDFYGGWTILECKLYICGYNVYALYPKLKDYVDIRNTPIEELQDKLFNYAYNTKSYDLCAYCRGTFYGCEKIRIAEQL